MKQREIVWIKFPFTNLKGIKERPCLIMSSNKYNSKHKDIIVCGITSNKKRNKYLIPIENPEKGRLHIASFVRADKLALLSKQLVFKSYAQVDQQTFDRVKDLILECIAS